ncbi:hypothetical protein FLL66_02060 [Vibrio cholerae]|uniref:LexA family transcriptional regulator n=1 Tax=Vibrio cholerae TaxID=666 RepID=UPI0011595B3F|nr:XRE family transcriptional regulator [Vibrio cholerae]EGR0523739.1 hypothetical protein [Vibrio cholerae]EGR0598449.1 hypothetical protein [Vibrio cholerae]MVC36123.1 XRE family transcriptional regulator [Vibrio cholerae]TQQ34418.1 hypothetical protein FLL66_02060 [Vibrio cholerae]
MNALQERLKFIIGEQSLRSFAQEVGVSETMIRKYLKGGMPGLDNAARICATKGISVHWFATGEGDVYFADFDPQERARVYIQDEETALLDDFALIDGYHVTIEETTRDAHPKVRRRLAFRKKWLEYRGLQPENLKIFFVKSYIEGALISGGDSVMIDTSDTEVSDGVFAIELLSNTVIRWLKARIDGSVDVYSDIDSEPDENVAPDMLDKIKILGRVVWLGKDFK